MTELAGRRPDHPPLSRCAAGAAADRVPQMTGTEPTRRKTLAMMLPACIAGGLLGGAAVAWFLKTGDGNGPPPQSRDAALVRSLLDENLTGRSFDFATVAQACSGKRVLPLTDEPAHARVVSAIERALAETIRDLNAEDSPVRKLRRINEASRFFEEGLMSRLDAMPGLRCGIPATRGGSAQRAGYPDLRILDEESGSVFYLDPKLVEQGSLTSTLRTFYFEPKNETLKITDDAVHLLAGIEHDGRAQQWTFKGWRLVDLSTLRVRLKAEFQASNADLYRKSGISPAPESP
jgi:hypothetical protein